MVVVVVMGGLTNPLSWNGNLLPSIVAQASSLKLNTAHLPRLLYAVSSAWLGLTGTSPPMSS